MTLVLNLKKKEQFNMYTDAVDAINYIKNNLKIKIDKEFNSKEDTYEVIVRLFLDDIIISQDSIEFDAI